MPDAVVLCGELAATRPGLSDAVRLSLTGPKANIRLRISDIERRMLSNVKDELADLLDIATYVYCADQLVSRGGAAGRSLGKDWRRNWRFTIPVRRPELWSDEQIDIALRSTLGFMADDDFRFDFKPIRHAQPIDTYLDYAPGNSNAMGEEVALFSGGLDSLSGTVQVLRTERSRLFLISHQSSTKIAAHQRRLVAELTSQFPGRILHTGVHVNKIGMSAVENTQRTRSFLYAAIASVIAGICGAPVVRFYENGIVSYNLPVAQQVVGARATRSTHPKVLAGLRYLMSLVLGRRLAIDNPLIWKTKGEVAGLLDDHGYARLIAGTVSCSSVRTMTRDMTHCGHCSQCLDRRFGVLSENLGGYDPATHYGVDLLTGARDHHNARVMATSFVRHAQELAGMTDRDFLARFGGEVARTTKAFPDLKAEDVARKAVELHRRHGKAVVRVLEEGFRRHSLELAEGLLQSTCILRIAGGGGPLPAPIRNEKIAAEAKKPTMSATTSQIVLGLDQQRSEVLILGLEPIRGSATFSLLDTLATQHDADLRSRLSPDRCSFCSTKRLTKELEVDAVALRRRVIRFRRQVAARFEERHGLSLRADAIIESKKWQGYRLNPAVRLADAAELSIEGHEIRPGASRQSAKGKEIPASAGR